MPLQIVRQDITKMDVDAIVNAANKTLLGGGGVDGSIHRAAGKGLLDECKKLGGCETGNAKITKGCNLPCKYVIHTVGPVWHGGQGGEEKLLRSCYRTALELAKKYKLNSVAFPLISTGAYGYPKDMALKAAVDVITQFLFENDMTVYIVVFDKSSFDIGTKLFCDIKEYIDDSYAKEHDDRKTRLLGDELQIPYNTPCSAPLPSNESTGRQKSPSGLERALETIDESFSQMLMRKIDESSMTDVQCYKKANISRKLFSKIRSDKFYKPSKPTAIAFAIALELPLSEMNDMLMKAGFALSHSNKFDIIIEYFVKCKNYNIFEINEALFAFDQSLLGA